MMKIPRGSRRPSQTVSICESQARGNAHLGEVERLNHASREHAYLRTLG